jgi:hypothetical protein
VLKRKAKGLVVDANVARCCGGEGATHPTSKNCRDFLDAIRTICHQVVIAPDVAEEWRRHRSRFFQTWRVSMTARRKIVSLEVGEDHDLRARISACASSPKDAEAMLKDCHLIEAALASDRIVISLDETARGLFSTAARRVRALKLVVWVNPDRSEEEPIDWLEGGAERESHRRLGFDPERSR